MDIQGLLKHDESTKGASDLFITAGVPPSIKIDGKINARSRAPRLTPEQTWSMVTAS
jgi:Tfp pilus assembly ATPase PilU